MAPPRDNHSDEINLNDNLCTKQHQQLVSPYASKRDPMSNLGSFKIIESTLRGIYYFFDIYIYNPSQAYIFSCMNFIEGEQFANAFFSTEKKIGRI